MGLYLYIDIIHYHILQSHSRYCYEVNYLKLIWIYSPKIWHSNLHRRTYVACDLSVWEGKLNEAL